MKKGAAIDWARVHERLAHAAGSGALETGTDRAEELLAQRATALAAPVASTTAKSAGLSAVVATIAGERYAVESAFVWRVMSQPPLTRLPGVPEIVLGVTNLYGEALPVFDPRLLLGLGGVAQTAGGRVLVLGKERADLGLAVDAVHEVTAVLTDQLLAVPDSLQAGARPLVRGVLADGLILLDGARLMLDSRLLLARTEPA
jgi:purine-binding chemotaxis protein CheW